MPKTIVRKVLSLNYLVYMIGARKFLLRQL